MKFLKKELNRRDFLKVGGLSASGAILAACGGQAADDGGGEEPAAESGGEEEMEEEMEEETSDAAPAEEAGEIVWWYGWGNLEPAVDTMIGLESFQEHIGNNTLTHKPSTSGEEFLTAFAAGEPPDGGSNTDYPGFWARGVAVPVDDMIAGSSVIDLSDTTPGFGDSLRYDGQLIGVPAIESLSLIHI